MDRSKTDRKKFHFIYRTTNLLNGRYYVGLHSTDKVDDDYIGSGKRFWNEVNKYGRENFKREIVEFFPSRRELKARERDLVNEEMLNDPLCMNLKLGGEGGWDHITSAQQSENGKKGNAKMRILREEDSEWVKAMRHAMSVGISTAYREGRRTPTPHDWTGRSHSEETKAKIGEAARVRSAGSGNSQFGTCWVIKDGSPIKIKKELLDEMLLCGYRRGRK